MGIAATLPAGAGLASSAALIVAVSTAILRMLGATMSARRTSLLSRCLRNATCSASRAVRSISGRSSARPMAACSLLDCHTGGEHSVPWPWPRRHPRGLRHRQPPRRRRRRSTGTRRDETELGLAALGVASCQELSEAAIDASALEPVIKRRLRHVMGETARAVGAAEALRAADLARTRSSHVGEPPIAARPVRGQHAGAGRRGRRRRGSQTDAPEPAWSEPALVAPSLALVTTRRCRRMPARDGRGVRRGFDLRAPAVAGRGRAGPRRRPGLNSTPVAGNAGCGGELRRRLSDRIGALRPDRRQGRRRPGRP